MKGKTLLAAAALLLLRVGAFAQDTPEDIAKKDLPKKARCVVCDLGGAGHGEEKPAAGVRYKGKTYYFCHINEVARFKQDPEAFMPPVLPRPLPKFALKDVQEQAVTQETYKGKVLLVDFWATWCAPCVEAMPHMQKLHDRHADKDFRVVGISIDEEGTKKVKPFLAKRKFTYPILLDNDTKAPAWKAFGVHGLPTLLLVDRDGQIVRQWTGKIDKKEVEQAVASLLEAKPAGK